MHARQKKERKEMNRIDLERFCRKMRKLEAF